MNIKIPCEVESILSRLKNAGFEAYIVGGCVRDCIMGKTPDDWDITTSALPTETKTCFSDYSQFDSGLKHGTVTIHIKGKNYEITTFRIDGEYSDNRRPNNVNFTDRLQDDLSRRDFTMNAIAYSPERGLIDYFGGFTDINTGLIRCVGASDKRFKEDALRIMRALRFSASLGFSIEKETAQSILKNRFLINNIAVERINSELVKLICGDNCGEVLRQYRSVFAVFIPEIEPMFGFDQRNIHHIYDVWEHTVKAVECSAKALEVRLALLLHDSGKPNTFTAGKDGTGHFHGHQKESERLAADILSRLRFDKASISNILLLIKYHDHPLDLTAKGAKRMLNRLGESNTRLLLEVKRGDTKAHNPIFVEKRLSKIEEFSSLIDNVISKNECFSIKNLDVNGKDLMKIGVPEGELIGRILGNLTEMVIDDKLENEKAAILEYVRKEFKF